MKLDVRLDKKIDPTLRPAIETRARFALTRLSPNLLRVYITVATETRRDGGRATCRVSGLFERGGSLHMTSSETSLRAAVDLALDRFRQAGFRELARRRTPAAREEISDGPSTPTRTARVDASTLAY